MKRLLLATLILFVPVATRAQTASVVALQDTILRLQDQGARRKLLQEAVRQHPNEAWPHLALALAYGGDVPAEGPPAFRRDPGEQGWKELERAVAADPSSASAAMAMAVLALAGSDDGRLNQARQALVRAGAPDVSGGLAVALAQVEIRLGDYPAATAAAQAASNDSTWGPAARRALGIGLMRLPGSGDDGAHTYLAGSAWGHDAAEYFGDAAPIATRAERDAWRQASTDRERAAFLAEFWSRRAAAAGVSTEDRLVEHFHRMAVADREYRRRWVPSTRLDVPEGPEGSDLAYDDRGLVYLRYGAPHEVAGSGDLRAWVYWRSDAEPLRIFFLGTRFADGIPLSNTVAGSRRPLAAGATPYDAPIDVLQELAPGDLQIERIKGNLQLARQNYTVPRVTSCGRRRCPDPITVVPPDTTSNRTAAADIAAAQAELTSILKKRTMEALAGEDARPTVDRALPFLYDFATFRGAAGMTDVVVSLVIAGDQMPAFDYPDGRALYAPRIQVALAGVGSGAPAFADSALQRMAPRRLVPGEFVRFILPLTATPAHQATYRIGVRVFADSVVGQVYGGTMPVPDYSAPGVKLSDVVLADGRDTGGWRRGAVALSLMPARRFQSHGVIKLFYEIYGLAEGAAYRTEVAVEPEGSGAGEDAQVLSGKGRGLSLAAEGIAHPDASGTVQEVRLIRPDLKPGRYRVVVTVTAAASGEHISRERGFQLLP